jgi:RHS repeat-associated protein
MNARNGSAITWYSYNLPNRIDKGSNYSQFFYGADRSRYKQVAVTAAGGPLPVGTETTIYARGLFDKVTKSTSTVVEYKPYIMAGGEAVAIRTLRSNDANDTRYLHKDHLGSVDVITNESGGVVQRLSYDAFGKRRNATAWAGGLVSGDWTSIAAITHRGFTFHEELDNLDLVHMNGRLYDPNIGRFISAGPFIQAPLMSQSLNRYSYVMNNPLSMTDPSGYSWLSRALRGVGGFIKRYWREIVAVVVAYFTGYYAGGWASGAGAFGQAVTAGAAAGAAYGATTAALYGGNLGSIFRSALVGGIAGGIAAGIGYGFGELFGGATIGSPRASVDFGWNSLASKSADTAATNAANSGVNAAVTDAIAAAMGALRGKRFASERGAVMALDKAFGAISDRFNAEIGASIYERAGRFGRQFVVGEATTSMNSETIRNWYSPSTLATQLAVTRVSALWHTYPGRSNDFSDRLSNKHAADIESYIFAPANGYVTLLSEGSVLKFDQNAFERANISATIPNIDRFKCVVTGASAQIRCLSMILSRLIFLYVLLIMFAIESASAASNKSEGRVSNVSDASFAVSMYQLIANPEKYEGKKIAVWGLISTGGNDSAVIWPNATSYEKRVTVDGIYVQLDNGLFKTVKKIDGRWVMIEGIFRARVNYENVEYAGAIEPVTRLKDWGD